MTEKKVKSMVTAAVLLFWSLWMLLSSLGNITDFLVHFGLADNTLGIRTHAMSVIAQTLAMHLWGITATSILVLISSVAQLAVAYCFIIALFAYFFSYKRFRTWVAYGFGGIVCLLICYMLASGILMYHKPIPFLFVYLIATLITWNWIIDVDENAS